MSLAKKPLTDVAIRKLKPAPKGKRPIQWDGLVPGFGVRSTDKGRHTYVLVKRFGVAKHPTAREIAEVGAITLEAARATAQRWNEFLKANKDPRIEEKRRRDEEEGAKREAEARKHHEDANTFTAAFEGFCKHHLSTLRTGKDVEQIMRRVLIPKWGGRPLVSIGRKDILAVIYELHDAGSPIAANRVLAYLKRFFAWTVDRGILDASPAALIRSPAKENKRDRVLSDAEIRAVWQACARLGTFGPAIRLLLATGQRLNEVASMTWGEVDRENAVWTLPRERTKADRVHQVPLSRLALSILEAVPEAGAHVFTTTGKGPLRGWSKAKGRIDQIAGVHDWHLHDLRRTVATGMAKLGVDRIVIGRVLNHAEQGVTAVYDRHRREPEVRVALTAWSAALEQIVDPRPATDTVVPIGRGRR